MAADDRFEAHLKHAAELFAAGDLTKAGQIWQAILKKDPANRAAMAGLYQLRQHLDQLAAEVDCEQLLREGCTLFDMGEVRDALAKWERILAAQPRHKLATAYVNDARRELGLPPLPAPGAEAQGAPAEPPRAAQPPGPSSFQAPAPEALQHPAPQALQASAPSEIRPPDPARAPAAGDGGPPLAEPSGAWADQLVLEGSQLYDLGMADEAVAKWERALELVPDHTQAPAYLEMARQDLARERARPSAPQPAPPQAAPDSGIHRAEQLLEQQHLEEAAQAFQRLLAQFPHDARVNRGYHRARALLNARDEPPLAAWSSRPALDLPAAAPEEPNRRQPVLQAPVGQPLAVTASRPPQRDGFRLPGRFPGGAWLGWLHKRITLPRRLREPRNLAIALGSLLVVILGLSLYGVHRQEVALREAVAAAERSALRPVSRMVEIPSLVETADAIRQEGEGALADAPLLAYYRAQACLELDPYNAPAQKLADLAKARLAGLAPAGAPADFDKTLASGDLEAARGSILDQLAKAPDDLELKDRARRVELALAPIYAAKDRIPEARAALLLGRAMFPHDPTWQVRLRLLEAIQAMAAPERTPWFHLLG